MIRPTPPGYYPQAMKAARVRVRYRFRGVIQGVGFRPTVYRCALALGLAGFVRNQRSEVVAELEGPGEAVERFPQELRRLLPPAARLDALQAEPLEPSGEEGFRIVESLPDAYRFPPIPPDLALCAQCAAELLDPRDRRYLYPFITCTQCGPRYSIVERTPFDRETTSMADFRQCPECLREYGDPDDRRFHSQTNSCPACGPKLGLTDAGGRPLPGDPLLQAVAALQEGRVLALQGIGGFHLAADPRAAAGGGPPAQGQGTRAQALRPHGRGPAGGPRPVPAGRRRPGAAGLPCRPDPDPADPTGGSRSPGGGQQHRHPGNHAALHSAAPAALPPSAGPGRLPAPDHDLRQPQGRADPHRSRRRPAPGWGRPRTCSSPTTGGSCSAPTTRCCGSATGRRCSCAAPADTCPA